LKLSIIIVNYKSSHFIKDCLQSAVAFESYKSFEWIIVDNDSKDQSKEILLNEFPFLLWHDMGYNAGFARANNAGIKLAKGASILLLNPDTLILNDAINVCLQEFEKSTNVACGVQMLNKDLTTQISGSHFMKGGLNHLLPLPYWGDFLKQISLLTNVKKPSIESASSEEMVGWISGAFLMVRSDVIKKCGLMDEDFFLYGEEVEWCSRLGKFGTLCIYGNIHIIHIMGEVISVNANSNDKSYTNLFDRKGLQLMMSNHVRIRKQYGIGWFLFQLLNYSFAIPVFFIGSFLKHLIHLNNPFKELDKVLGLTKNVLVIWSNLFLIIQNKPHFYKVL
jgi:GT2 family glycosyltransferase